MNMNESTRPLKSGHIKIYETFAPANVLYENHNAVCNTASWLFSRLLANVDEPQFGVWGLALGDGDPTWPANNQPDALPTQTTLVAPRLRKRLSVAKFVDADYNQVVNSTIVDFQTIINATTDNLLTPIREMGLIGGGTVGTDMTTADFFNPSAPDRNSVVLINYKTLPPLLLPAGVSFTFSVLLTMGS